MDSLKYSRYKKAMKGAFVTSKYVHSLKIIINIIAKAK